MLQNYTISIESSGNHTDMVMEMSTRDDGVFYGLKSGQRSQFSELVRYSRPLLTAAGVITLIIMVVGVVGNSLTVAALIRHKKIRTVAAAFIASLCVSDLLFCFFVLPFQASQFFHGTWIHGEILCSLAPMIRYGSVGVSLLSVATISINRYILIAWPQIYPRIYTKAKVACYITIIWLFSYGLQIPTFLGVWGTFGFDAKLGTCSIKKDENGKSSKTVLFAAGFAVPCIIIIICYAKIYLVVRMSRKNLEKHASGPKTKRSEMHITKMVLAIFLAFVVCYLPISIVKVFDSEVKHAPLHVLGYILLYFSSCLNPVIYVTMNKQYRQAYFDTIRCTFTPMYDSNTPIQHSKMSVSFFKNQISTNPKV